MGAIDRTTVQGLVGQRVGCNAMSIGALHPLEISADSSRLHGMRLSVREGAASARRAANPANYMCFCPIFLATFRKSRVPSCLH